MAGQSKDKQLSITSIVEQIPSGSTIAIGGVHMHSSPMPIIREIIRQGIDDLTIIGSISSGYAVDLLVSADLVKETKCCYVGFEYMGLAPAFRDAAEKNEIIAYDWGEDAIIYGLQAAAYSKPFAVMNHKHLLSNIQERNPHYKVINDPYTEKKVLISPPLKPDIALLHVSHADKFGNSIHLGPVVLDDIMAIAADKTFITTDEIISNEKIRENPVTTTIPGFLINGVYSSEYCAHPTSSPGIYKHDEGHLKEYLRLIKSGNKTEYLKKYIFDVPEKDYINNVGGSFKLIGLQY